jgi:thiosulfate reductase cytochrome b subunit
VAIRSCATLPVSPPVFAIALLSGAALGYEILLTRLFAIIQWHHFAYMMISAALLGYGAAGTVVTLVQRRLQARFTLVLLPRNSYTLLVVAQTNTLR